MNNEKEFKIEKEREIKIEVATIENLKDIQDLNHQLCVKESIEFDPTVNPDYPFQKEGEEYFKERIANGFARIVIIDEKIVGYLVGGISGSADYRKIGKVAEAENMYVIEGYRSLGIGEKLFQNFFDWCKRNGVKRVRAVASAKNVRGIEFYKNRGLKEYDVVLEGEI